MSACEVARLDVECDSGERRVAITVVDDYRRFGMGLTPPLSDLPDDMRAALLHWLGAASTNSPGG